jgi:hypothetical protein
VETILKDEFDPKEPLLKPAEAPAPPEPTVTV